MTLAMPPTTQPTLPTSRETLPQTQDAMKELSLLWFRLIVLREVGVTT
jgi:predicted secreted protein